MFFKESVSQQYINNVKTKYVNRFDNLFPAGATRIVIPIHDNILFEIKNKLEKGETKSKTQYMVDLSNMLAIKQVKTNIGIKNVSYKLGKIIQLELDKSYLDQYSALLQNEDISDIIDANECSIILSRNPVDILRMSDCGNIRSCHSEGDIHFESAIDESIHGGLTAYLVNSKDISSINLSSDEIFNDTSRGIKGITPISRIRVSRYSFGDDRDDREEIAMPSSKEYNNNRENIPQPGFYKTLLLWLQNQQQDFIDEIKRRIEFSSNKEKEYRAILKSFSRHGGEYSDDRNDGKSILNKFFDEKGFNGDIPLDEDNLDSKEAIWNDEIEEILTRVNNKYKYIHFWAYAETYTDFVNISAHAGLNMEFEIKNFDLIHNDKWRRQVEFYIKQLFSSYSSTFFEDKVDNVDITSIGDTSIQLYLSWCLNEINTPDDLRYYENDSDIEKFETEKFANIKDNIQKFLTYMQEKYDLYASGNNYKDYGHELLTTGEWNMNFISIPSERLLRTKNPIEIYEYFDQYDDTRKISNFFKTHINECNAIIYNAINHTLSNYDTISLPNDILEVTPIISERINYYKAKQIMMDISIKIKEIKNEHELSLAISFIKALNNNLEYETKHRITNDISEKLRQYAPTESNQNLNWYDKHQDKNDNK